MERPTQGRRRSSLIPDKETVKSNETQNLMVTYAILIVLLLILWVLYSGFHQVRVRFVQFLTFGHYSDVLPSRLSAFRLERE